LENRKVIRSKKLVIPAEAGIHNLLLSFPLLQGKNLDSRLHACALKRYGAQARE
jgi:hypothetical protein